jgi:purine-nucleoside phosphorylase
MRRAEESAAFIAGKSSIKEETTALVLGSGLGGLAEQVKDAVVIPYGDIPHFPVSTAPGHAGKLLIGMLAGKPVVCMQGRVHYYEGIGMDAVTYPVRVLRALGVKTLILTNAAGCLHPEWKPGELMLITDHINFMGVNPLVGSNADDFGPRFPDMSAYTPGLLDLARKCAGRLGITLREGVYAALSGPSYETPAEIRMLKAWGASAAGMSTVPEVIVARHSGLRVLAISCLTNYAAGILNQPLSGEEVNEAAAKAGPAFARLLSEIAGSL